MKEEGVGWDMAPQKYIPVLLYIQELSRIESHSGMCGVPFEYPCQARARAYVSCMGLKISEFVVLRCM
jgi:hypothetical protein